MAFEEMAKDFLAQKRIAVVGASRSGQATGNAIYRALKQKGYAVVPVHPVADKIEGDACYPNLQAIPEGVDGVFIAARPEVSEQVVHDAVEAGVPRVWMHYNAMFGAKNSSVSSDAVTYGREHGLTVIDGGCPLMFMDFGHKCMRWILGVTGKLPS